MTRTCSFARVLRSSSADMRTAEAGARMARPWYADDAATMDSIGEIRVVEARGSNLRYGQAVSAHGKDLKVSMHCVSESCFVRDLLSASIASTAAFAATAAPDQCSSRLRPRELGPTIAPRRSSPVSVPRTSTATVRRLVPSPGRLPLCCPCTSAHATILLSVAWQAGGRPGAQHGTSSTPQRWSFR